MKDLSHRALLQRAVADGATTPDPGSPGWAWSTVESAPIYWDGAAWIKSAAGLSAADSVDAIYIDLYLDTNAATLALSAGPTIDITLPPFTATTGINLSTGQTVFIKHTTYSGIWVVGSTAVPTAVPLTRHVNWPITAKLRAGTKIVCKYAVARPYSGAAFTDGVGNISTNMLDVNTSTDKFTGTATLLLSNYWFKFISLDSGAALPGGLTLGNWYVVDTNIEYGTDPSNFTGAAAVYDTTLAAIDFTTTGTNGSSFIIGVVNVISNVQHVANIEIAINAATIDGSWDITDSSELQLYIILDSAIAAGQFNRGIYVNGTDSLALGESSSSLGEGSTALGNRSKAYGYGSTSVGSYAESRNGGTAVGYDSRAYNRAVAVGAQANKINSSAFGRSTFSDSQVAFQNPESSRYRDGIELQQLYLDSTNWSVAAYPTKLYTSTSQRTNMSTRSGWRVYGQFSGIVKFSGRCVSIFRNTSGDEIGYAVHLVEGSARQNSASIEPVISYRVIEEESSFPGTITITLTPSEDPIDPTAMIEVELSCSIAIATATVDAYMGVMVWGIHESGSISGSYTNTKVNRDGLGILLPASETLSAGNLVNVWNDSGTIKMRKADADAPYNADGYVLQAITSGDSGYMYIDGVNDAISGLTLGSQFLSATAGVTTTTAPTTTGNIVQSVGIALTSTKLLFQRGLPILLS